MADSLFTELKRRNVFKVGVAYLVLAWVVIQVTDSAVPALHLPDWVNSLVFFLGAIGFPFALFFAWVFEVTPEGIKKESDISPEDSVTTHTGRKLDFIIIGLLVAALGYFIYESRFETQLPETAVNEARTTEVEPAKEVIEEPEGSSIAVLPFVNMSSDKEQEYFSDGISEEILNVLAKIPKLHVTSRSSAFAFKGKDLNLTEVANKLGVKNILEGSVRKFGNRIRITAQLIEAGSDKHLWSETYDRELTDLFAIQDEISAAIVEELKSKLGLNTKLAERDMRNVNLDAHNEYLKGRFYVENRNQQDLEKALIHFDRAIEIAPDYAPAWMGKGWAIEFLSETSYGYIPREVAFARARVAIEKALELNPELPEAYGILGLIEFGSFNEDKGTANYKKAIELNPNYADVYSWYANQLFDEPEKRLKLREKAVQLSPMSILANSNYAHELIDYGKLEEAEEVAKQMLIIDASHPFPYTIFGSIQQSKGNYAEASNYYKKTVEYSPGHTRAKFELASLLAAIGLLEQAANVFDDSDFVELKYWYKGNVELFVSQVRELYPRVENDSLGLFIRAQAEARTENYSEAVKYYKKTKFGVTDDERIYSYQQVGETEVAQTLLDKSKALLLTRMDAKAENFGREPIEVRSMTIAYLEQDIDKAILNLKKAMDKKYIINYYLKTVPMYKKLRQHPEWPAILAESDKRAAKQREIYLNLVAEKEVTTL
ncbi:MAG: TolB-like protein/Tfp pilus assembly protein PilF [Enterobacterales bacterium]|jgi:TolB-like protein/Tfp pilus assembly protein PilF